MEQGISVALENPAKTLLFLNGSCTNEQSISPQNEDVSSLDGIDAHPNHAVSDSPIRAHDRNEGRPASPLLSNQNCPLKKEEIKLQDNVDAEFSTRKGKLLINAASNTHLKHSTTADVLTTEKGIPLLRTTENVIETSVLDGTNQSDITANATKASNSSENVEFSGCGPQSAAIVHSTEILHQSSKLESEMKPFQSCNPHGAIEEGQARAVSDEIKPKVRPSSDATPTALNPAESNSNVETVERAEKAPLAVTVDEKLEDGLKSNDCVQSLLPLSSLDSRVGDSQSQSAGGHKSLATCSSGDQSHNSQPPIPSATENPTESASNQKTPSKARGNAMIFIPDLSDELLQGYRILTEIFGDKCKSFVWPFLDAVDSETLWDYELKVKHPMWLRKIESKFVSKEYKSITEFAVDMRQILENCYRYNGMKHQISKYAQTLECVFEQKLALLSRPLQEKTTLYLTSDGKYRDGCPDTIELSSGRLRRSCTRLASRAMEQASATPLAFHIRRELDQQERENKRQKIVDRRDEIIKERQDLLEWDKQMIGETNWTYMKSLWEIPAIGHFLSLCQSVLELDEISFFELERSFAIPMESMMLRRIFTTLLSTPYQRTRLGKKPPMPYKVWEARLREWVRGWYVVLDKLDDPLKVYEKIGVPERFFEVLGPNFPLDRVQYHELTYYERVWVVKALCDQLFETQLAIRRCVLSQPIEDQRPIVLGVDGDSNSYIHFPQFCGADLRVYRQSKYPDLSRKIKKDKGKDKEARDLDVKDDAPPPPRKHRKRPNTRKKITQAKSVPMETSRARPSRLRQRLTPTVHFGTYAESIVSSTESEDVTSEFTEVEDEQDESENQSEPSGTSDKHRESAEETEDEEEEEGEEITCASGIHVPENTAGKAAEVDIVKQSGEEKHQPSHNTGTIKPEQIANETLDLGDQKDGNHTEKDQTEQSCNGDALSRSSPTSENSLAENLSKPSADIEKRDAACEEAEAEAEESPDPSVDNGTCSRSTVCSGSQDRSVESEGRSATTPPEGIAVAKTQNTNNNSSQASDAPCHLDHSITPDDKPCETIGSEGEAVGSPLSPPKPHVEVLPVLGEFELVCDSMDSLRELIDKFAPLESRPAPPTTGRKRRAAAYVKQPIRRRCEKELYEKLTNLLLELTPWEAKLAKFAMRNRERFKKEYKSSKFAPETDQDIKDIWASEESSSESESSESESEDEEEPMEDHDEEWNASGDSMRLRKRTRKPPASVNQDDDESINEDILDASMKLKRPRPSGRSQQSRDSKKSPPHKNQLNTSLLEIIKKLSEDGLKDVSRRLQTMIKRGEATRNQKTFKSEIHSASLLGYGDGQAVTALLNKMFWVAAKPPAVEGIIAQSVEELISVYPIFVQNLIFRNLKNGLGKISKAAKSAHTDLDNTADQKNESYSKEGSATQVELSKEASTPGITDVDCKSETSSTSSKMETRYSLSNTPKEGILKLGSTLKTKEVMDDLVLQGLYVVLDLTKRILRERLAIGLSELLPDYTNLQETAVEVQGDTANSCLGSSRNQTDKDLLLKMLPKPSQYLKDPKLTSDIFIASGMKYASNIASTSTCSTTRPANSILVSVPTAKLSIIRKSQPKKEPVKGTIPAPKPPQADANPAAATTSDSQSAGNSGSVPHGVYTIKVDANIWSQLQGKPELQQQFVLQQIKDMQQKQAESGLSSTSAGGSVNSPAQAVTCIRSQPKAPVAAQRTTVQTGTTNSPVKNTGRLPQCKNMPNMSDLSSLQPIKVSKQSRPKSLKKSGMGFGEAASNLSQRELIVLLQQQQRQLELHRQQQQQKLQLKKIEEQQHLPQSQQEKQHFVLSASGALVSPTRPQQLTGVQIPKAQVMLNVTNSTPMLTPNSLCSQNVLNSSNQMVVVPSLSTQPTRLSTKTSVTTSMKLPKMTVNPVDFQPGAVALSAATIQAPACDQYPQTIPETAMSHNPTSATISSNSSGTRLHLVQTSKGNQFILQTGSSQAPRLVSLSSSVNVGNSGNTLPVMLAGQNAQFVKQVNQAAAVAVSSSSGVAVSHPNQQTVKFVMQPHQTVSNNTLLSLPQGLLQPGQPGQALQLQLAQGSGNQLSAQAATSTLIPDAVANCKQPRLHVNQDVKTRANIAAAIQSVGLQVAPTGQTPSKISPSQFVQLHRQSSPTVIQKPQLAVLRGLGDSKIVIGNPAKVVRLVHPSLLSTAASFVPTPDQGQIGKSQSVATRVLDVASQARQVLNQTPVRQQLVHLPIQSGKMGSVVASQLSTPVTQVSSPVSGSNIQEHLQQVIFQQLASGKLKLSPQTVPTLGTQVSQQQASIQQLNAGNLIKTLPVVLSQQVPQLVTKIQQSIPPTVISNPITAAQDAQFIHQSQTNVLQNVQILNPSQTVQTPTVRLIGATNVPNQAHPAGHEPQGCQLVSAACSDIGSTNSIIQFPTAMVDPTQVIVPASHLVQTLSPRSTPTIQQVISHAVPVGTSSQQILPSQDIIQKGVKRPLPVPNADTVAKLPRHIAPDQVLATQAAVVTSFSGLNNNTSQGSNQ